MKKIILATIFSATVLTTNVANATPSWLEKIFGSSEESTEQKTKKEKKEKTDKKVKKEQKNKNNKHANKRKGSPDHAPAHGYRKKFKHYPDANIYEDTEKGIYFEKDGNTWKPVYEIPQNIDLGKGVSIDLDEAIPEVIRMFSK